MFFILLFSLTTFLFKNAFSVYFFSDDFFFLKISRIHSFSQFLNFFSPFKEFFYRPLTSEVFYFIIHLLEENIFVSHSIVFIVYFFGLYFLYKIIYFLSKNKFLSYLTTGFYAISFTHVFQLYFFGTFQEVGVFTFLIISFYYYLKEKNIASLIFFILALLSKEIALLFLPFVFIFSFINKKYFNKKIVYYFFTSIFFAFIYKSGLAGTTSLDNYKVQFSPRLFANNYMWYFLWSLGFPNFTSLYFTSVFKPPIAEFWKMLNNFPNIKLYYQLLASYYLIFFSTTVVYLLKNQKQILKFFYWIFGLLIYFSIFIIPIIILPHRWMVRLTIPLIFIVLIQAFIIRSFIKGGRYFRLLGFILISIYFGLNVLGISIHESSSLYFLESKFTTSAKKYFEKNQREILKHEIIYFQDPPINKSNPWGGSKKLKVTLGDQSFIDLYFPDIGIKAVYGFETKIKPKNSYTIQSIDILTGN